MDKHLFAGIDVGGTFTDLVLYDRAGGRMKAVKVPSTPPEFWPSVIESLRQAGVGSGDAPTVFHGTTVHLNAFLERKGARMALVTTAGFGDVYEMRRGNRPTPYDMHFRYPDPIVKRRDVFEVAERTMADGSVRQAPSHEDISALAERLRQGNYEAIAICFLHSYKNPAHERQVADILQAELPGVVICPSHDVCREWREYERTSTSVINAYVSPVLQRYLSDLLDALSRESESRLYLLQSNGGLMDARTAGSKGVLSLLSGPVGGNVAGQTLARESGYPDLVCIDMGGTSFEASLVVGGESAMRTEREVGGFPILSPMVDIHTIGAGGGSIAWRDGNSLRVGPRSAGARPGPACYGHGGTEPTVTDANIALGRIEDGAAFGDMRLDVELAKAAIARFAEQFDMDGPAMAQGMLDVINEQMANAIRTITVRRGIDPRNFALVAYGGAGPMHAADIADLLGIETVIVPKAAGTFSAWGMLQSNIVHDRAETILQRAADIDWPALDRRLQALESELGALLADQGIEAANVAFERALDVRYVGQEHSIAIPLDGYDLTSGEASMARLRKDFDTSYEHVFGHSNPDEDMEVATIRLRGIGQTGLDASALFAADTQEADADVHEAIRSVRFANEPRDTAFVHRSALQAGTPRSGPCVIKEDTCTTIVPPGFSAQIDASGNLVLKKENSR